jgi:hypothetical protein
MRSLLLLLPGAPPACLSTVSVRVRRAGGGEGGWGSDQLGRSNRRARSRCSRAAGSGSGSCAAAQARTPGPPLNFLCLAMPRPMALLGSLEGVQGCAPGSCPREGVPGLACACACACSSGRWRVGRAELRPADALRRQSLLQQQLRRHGLGAGAGGGTCWLGCWAGDSGRGSVCLEGEMLTARGAAGSSTLGTAVASSKLPAAARVHAPGCCSPAGRRQRASCVAGGGAALAPPPTPLKETW